MNKPRVFLNVGTYLPGYRGGGPTQSIKNLVEALSDNFEFYIFTANHDLGITNPYDNVDTDEWNIYNGVSVFYSSEKNKMKNLKEIFEQQKFSLIFLNSFFSTDTIRILYLRKKLNLGLPIVLMPRGELSEGALSIKRHKKMFYLNIAKLIGMLNGIRYLVTADDEYEQVRKLLHTDKIYKVSNIPNTKKELTLDTKVDGKLKVVFLSRITQKKNLDYALKTLRECKSNIIFDIYGTMEEISYWEKCQEIINSLPNNISVNYKGELPNELVITTLSNYDLFYFPTKSENYGHVISEALQASIPILISDQTPWKKLREKKIGWEFSLSNTSCFINTIDQLSMVSLEDYNMIKKNIYSEFNIDYRVSKTSAKYRDILRLILDGEG